MIESHKPVAQKKRPTGPNPARYQNLADLLHDVYGARRKRLAINKADLAAMKSASMPEAEQREELLSLAASDRTLERSRELLLLSSEKLVHQPLAGQVRDFIREVLRRHPAYQLPSLRIVLEDQPEATAIDTAIIMLEAQSFAQLQWPDGTPPLNKRQVEALKLASLHCLLIWALVTCGTSLERIQQYLYSTCWVKMEGRQSINGKCLRTLLLARDPMALGIVCSSPRHTQRRRDDSSL